MTLFKHFRPASTQPNLPRRAMVDHTAAGLETRALSAEGAVPLAIEKRKQIIDKIVLVVLYIAAIRL
jgi:hypothetical protein